MGRQPARRRCGASTARAHARRGQGAVRPPRRPARPRAARCAASRSPTSRSSRSPRRSRFDARVLIMDEPTAALSGHEVERLFARRARAARRGAAVLFISHRFDEVFALCDTVTVMRDGAVTHDGDRSPTLDHRRVVRRMVGREVAELFPKQAAEIGDVVLDVQRLTRDGVFHDVSSRSAAARSSASPAWSAPAAARSPARSSASTRPTRGHVEVDGVRLKPGSPARGDARRHRRSCPRTAASRAWSWSSRSRATSALTRLGR